MLFHCTIGSHIESNQLTYSILNQLNKECGNHYHQLELFSMIKIGKIHESISVSYGRNDFNFIIVCLGCVFTQQPCYYLTRIVQLLIICCCILKQKQLNSIESPEHPESSSTTFRLSAEFCREIRFGETPDENSLVSRLPLNSIGFGFDMQQIKMSVKCNSKLNWACVTASIEPVAARKRIERKLISNFSNFLSRAECMKQKLFPGSWAFKSWKYLTYFWVLNKRHLCDSDSWLFSFNNLHEFVSFF